MPFILFNWQHIRRQTRRRFYERLRRIDCHRAFGELAAHFDRHPPRMP